MQDCGQCGIRLCYVDAPLEHGEIGKIWLKNYIKTVKNLRDQEKYFLELGLKEEDM